MEEKQIAAILVGAAATVFAARLARADKDGIRPADINLDLCGGEVFVVWRNMTKNVSQAMQTQK